MDSYAVISVGGKQYRVREGQRLLVDRMTVEEGKTFQPDLLMLGGDGDPKLGDGLKGQQVTAKVAAHVLGEKVVVGKHRRRTGYRRRNGFRARLTQIEIQTIGKKATRSTAAKKETAAKKPAAKKKSSTRKKSEEKA
ncbi:MAG: 50S ribosomal protein L21 [Gaiellaceae bacterium]